MEWKKYKLGEIAEITVGFPFESERFNTAGQGVRLVRGMNVSERYLRFGEDARWWDDISDKLQSYYLKENDIVIGMDGSKVGKNFALVKKDDLPLLLVQRVACIRAKENFDPKYIWHYISSPRFIEYVNTIKTGSSIPHISSSQIFNFPIFTPPFEEQRRCSAVLSSIDNKIALNRAINQNLEALAKQMYDYWFVQFDFPNEEGKPYKSSGGKMVWNEKLKRDIPEGWENTTLGDFCEMYQPQTIGTNELVSNGLYRVYGANGIVGRYDKYNHEESEIAMACRGNSCGVLNRTMPYSWITGNAMVIRMRNNDCCNEFIKQALPYMNIAGAITGSGQPQLTRENLSAIFCIKPMKTILQAFSNKVTPIVSFQLQLTLENEELIKQRDELLPLLMNGQVSLNSDLSHG